MFLNACLDISFSKKRAHANLIMTPRSAPASNPNIDSFTITVAMGFRVTPEPEMGIGLGLAMVINMGALG